MNFVNTLNDELFKCFLQQSSTIRKFSESKMWKKRSKQFIIYNLKYKPVIKSKFSECHNGVVLKFIEILVVGHFWQYLHDETVGKTNESSDKKKKVEKSQLTLADTIKNIPTCK